MPLVTYPNQREINIHRERAASNFLGIKNDNWMAASRALGAHALRLYLYLASNADGYRLALSPAAIQQQIGMPTSTYRDQFRKLESMHYIKHSHGNTYDFFERPYDSAYLPIAEKEEKAEGAVPVLSFEDNANAAVYIQPPVDNLMSEDREINNMQTTDITMTTNTTAIARDVRYAPSAYDLVGEDWFMFATSPDEILTEKQLANIKAWREEEAKRPKETFEPKPGAFEF